MKKTFPLISTVPVCAPQTYPSSGCFAAMGGMRIGKAEKVVVRGERKESGKDRKWSG